MADKDFTTIVVGAGIGGISAALASARLGVPTLLLEKESIIGGTSVNSPVGLVCSLHDSNGRAVNAGLNRSFFPEAFTNAFAAGINMTYDEDTLLKTYWQLLRHCRNLDVLTGREVVEVIAEDGVIRRVKTKGETEEWFSARVFVDGTAEGHFSAMSGAAFEFGRDNDGVLQPATLTFKVSGIDYSKIPADPPIKGIYSKKDKYRVYDAIQPLFTDLHERKATTNARTNILCFQYPDNKSLLFNQTRIPGVDPTDPESIQRGIREGRRQIGEFWSAISTHPAFCNAGIEKISEKLGIREGRRIIGDYQLTKEDCLGEARFDDMVAACSYCIDIHNPSGSGTTMIDIPGSGYYHIPYRSLVAKGFSNLVIGSRCISGTHEAHSSYRVMPPVSSIGEAAGTAAGIMGLLEKSDLREITAAQIRFVLKNYDQFVEGGLEEFLEFKKVVLQHAN